MPLLLSIAFNLICDGCEALLNGEFNAWRAKRKAQKVADAPTTRDELEKTLEKGEL